MNDNCIHSPQSNQERGYTVNDSCKQHNYNYIESNFDDLTYEDKGSSCKSYFKISNQQNLNFCQTQISNKIQINYLNMDSNRSNHKSGKRRLIKIVNIDTENITDFKLQLISDNPLFNEKYIKIMNVYEVNHVDMINQAI